MQKLIFLLLAMTCVVALKSQDKKPDSWDVNAPQGAWGWQDLNFTTDEGTWMNLDVSPDGQTIVFDMLGDIYQMPISGGKATVLRSGLAWEVQPRFSPDGSEILFTSDAGGGDNIWIMKADGSEATQVTKESFRLLNNAAWTPDGQYFVARKHFTSQRSLGAGEMWLYHRSGGSGIQLTKRKNDQQDVNEPTVSPDGRYVYFSEDMYPGGYFQYNKDPNSQIYVIKRYDRQEDKMETVVRGPGGACRPQLSNDGKHLAFVRRVREQSVLFVYNLETGLAYPIYDALSKDQQEAWAIFGVYTGFDWTPDDKNIIIWADGKIWQVPTDPNSKVAAKQIPFTAEVSTQVATTQRVNNPVFEDNFTVKVIRHLVTSPDEKTLVFSAVGYLWKMDVESKKVTRLTSAEHFEFEPAFSPDGSQLAYVSWDDQEKGSVILHDLSDGSSKVLTAEPGIYRTPSFSPDGQTVVFRKDGGNGHQGYLHCTEPGLYTVALDGGAPMIVTPKGEYPVFSEDGERIFFQTGGFLFGSLTKSFSSIKTNGSDEKKHFDGKYAQRFSISPDNKWIAWSELYKVYVAPFPKTGKSIGINAKTKAVPVAQVARDAGVNIHWSPDSKQLHWTLGNEYYSDELTERFSFLEGALDSLPPMDTIGMQIPLEVPMDQPEGMVAFTNARIITMEGDEVIEEGTILVDGNVIRSVGTSADVRIPRGVQIIDCAGKTIMPGIIDVHGHLGDFR
ncbi:MAG: amidohydrolase, partial [Bacteroidota bacterium]